jgi:hypothetical protein
MHDLHIRLANKPGELARLGEAMGRAGLPIEGGGAFTVDGEAHAHFLFKDGAAAEAAARAAGLDVVALSEVTIRRLRQGTPGQLGAIARALGEAGVNILTQYSDHAGQLILVTDDPARAQEATRAWAP